MSSRSVRYLDGQLNVGHGTRVHLGAATTAATATAATAAAGGRAAASAPAPGRAAGAPGRLAEPPGDARTRSHRAVSVHHSRPADAPAGVATATGCTGRVTIRVRRGSTTIATRRSTLSRSCTYRARVTFADRRLFGRATRLTVSARFEGNAQVLASAAPGRGVRIR